MRKLIMLILLALFINNSYAKELVMENQNDAFNEFATQLVQDEKIQLLTESF